MASPLPNRLVSHRKRAALSQSELAHLLGTQAGSRISRYERFRREPGLETLLALEAVFGKPASELFAGRYKQVVRRVAERARVLMHKSRREKSSALHQRKLQVLTAIIARESRP